MNDKINKTLPLCLWPEYKNRLPFKGTQTSYFVLNVSIFCILIPQNNNNLSIHFFGFLRARKCGKKQNIQYQGTLINILTFFWRDSPQRAMASSIMMFLDHTQRRTTVGRTPLDDWSARRRDLCLTTHNTHNRQTSMPPVGFEPTISTAIGRRPTL